MTRYRRYEILLAQRYNAGVRVPPALLRQTVCGVWRSGETSYEDQLNRLFVDVEDTPEHEQFFRDFKEALKQRFQQLEIWITSHDIRVL